MTGEFFLDWAVMTVSLFNTILLLWLGLTVFLNAERRTLGIWLAVSGLFMGAAFFLSHTTILGLGANYYTPGINTWWRLGWVPVVISPYAWYTIMLWYTGYWEGGESSVHRRHRLWFILITLITIVLTALLIFVNSLPSFHQITELNLSDALSLAGFPVMMIIYPIYILACIGLSLDALLRPGPTLRVMGQLARRRARPWLIGATFALLAVSLLVALVILWVASTAGEIPIYRPGAYSPNLARTVALFDLVIASLIATSVLLTGQAIVSYEVFTGKSLPRRGLIGYWRWAIILACGFSVMVGLGLTLSTPPIYSLLLSICLMVAFYALLGWRSYIDRQRFISNLRPFVSSQKLYEQLLNPTSLSGELDIREPFNALCKDVLEARQAYLIPLGAQAPLFGTPLAYPQGTPPHPASLTKVLLEHRQEKPLYISLEPKEFNDTNWAVPLWNQSGASGILLLGNKVNDGLYTQEEIEFSGTVCERLVDIQASAEMAKRLMALQRQRLVKSQVLDRQTRRVLHDDVLPSLHAAMLTLNKPGTEISKEQENTLSQLSDLHRQIADLLHSMPVDALQEVVQVELRHAFDHVNWQVAPRAAEKAEKLTPIKAEVLFYAAREAIRNAAQHARDETSDSQLRLDVTIAWQGGSVSSQAGLQILVEDNGVGIGKIENKERNSGQGLALHSTMLAVIGGELSVESTPGASTRITIHLPAESFDDPSAVGR